MFFAFSCKNPDREEFIGKWLSDDEAMIILYADSACIVRNLDPVKLQWNNSGIKEKINDAGTWELASPDRLSGDYRIYIDITGVVFPVEIIGTGHTGYFRPWKLCIYIGDPDDMNFYEFYKQ
jgi:hypothetical protein